MKKEVRRLVSKATDSLIVSIEHFNRPHDRGRVETVLILLDHAFELLLKAGIVHKGGRIRERGKPYTIGFDACVRRGLSDASIRFLTDEQALTLQALNGLRDAAQHYLVDLSEQQLYVHAQAGLTLFRELYRTLFNQELYTELPERVLPISTAPPKDLASLFDHEINEVKKLLQPRSRKRMEARAKMRGLAILNRAISGAPTQPSKGELDKLCDQIIAGRAWQDLFPGVASIDFTTDGTGARLSLRIHKKEGAPIQIVDSDQQPGVAVAIKRVNETDFYSMNLTQIAKKMKMTRPKTLALIRHLKIQEDADCFKEIMLGKVCRKSYSPLALDKLKQNLPNVDMVEVWEQDRRASRRNKMM